MANVQTSHADSHRHALVLGASGIIGWACVNALLTGYPTEDAFRKVTALTNRPLDPETELWPTSSKLQLISGIDILEGDQQQLEKSLQGRANIATVTHVYFCAYIQDSDPSRETRINGDLLRRTVIAIEKLAPNLEFVLLPIGTKNYGVIHVKEFPFGDLPMKESQPRIPEPFASNLFYYNQLDILQELSRSKEWSYCAVIPDVIVGYVPTSNYFCSSKRIARYLSLIREKEGQGARVPFPGYARCWSVVNNDSGQDIVARFSVFASLHPECTAGQLYNIADNERPASWSDKWPILCEYFGLRGMGPTESSAAEADDWEGTHASEWQALETKYGLRKVEMSRMKYQFPISAGMTLFDKDRPLSLKKAHDLWGDMKEETDIKTAWWGAFDRFRRAKMIP